MFHSCGNLIITKKKGQKNTPYCIKCNIEVETNLQKHTHVIRHETTDYTAIFPNKILTGQIVAHRCANEHCDATLAYEMVKPPMFGDEEDLILHKCVTCGRVTRESTRIS